MRKLAYVSLHVFLKGSFISSKVHHCQVLRPSLAYNNVMGRWEGTPQHQYSCSGKLSTDKTTLRTIITVLTTFDVFLDNFQMTTASTGQTKCESRCRVKVFR